MSQPIRGQGSHLVFPIVPKNTNLVEDINLRFCYLSSVVEFRSAVSDEKSKMLSKSEVRTVILFFRQARKTLRSCYEGQSISHDNSLIS